MLTHRCLRMFRSGRYLLALASQQRWGLCLASGRRGKRPVLIRLRHCAGSEWFVGAALRVTLCASAVVKLRRDHISGAATEGRSYDFAFIELNSKLAARRIKQVNS